MAALEGTGMSLCVLCKRKNALQRPRHRAQVKSVDKNPAIAHLATRFDAREAMELFIKRFVSPRWLILERPKSPQFALLCKNLLDRCQPKRADKFIFEISVTHEESESLHVRDRKIGPETSTFKRLGEVSSFSLITKTRQYRGRSDRSRRMRQEVTNRRSATHREYRHSLRRQVTSKTPRQGLESRLIALTLHENHSTHVDDCTHPLTSQHICVPVTLFGSREPMCLHGRSRPRV